MQLSIYQQMLDVGAATRWALLTHADDALVDHKEDGAGTQRLRYHFGMSELAMKHFNTLIEEHIKAHKLNRKDRVWSQAEGFADDVLVKFALSYPQYAHIFAAPTSVVEFSKCTAYVKLLWSKANPAKTAKTSAKTDPEPSGDKKDSLARGKALEYLAAYLFLLIPGLVPQRNVIPEFRDSEHDLVVHNHRSASNLEAEVFGRSLLVECKNLQSRVNVQQVGYFLYRMRLTHSRFGVIFARNGISGDPKKPRTKNLEKLQDHQSELNARSLMRRAFHEDGTTCVVIGGDDIEKIIENETTLRSLLMERANELRYGKPNTLRDKPSSD